MKQVVCYYGRLLKKKLFGTALVLLCILIITKFDQRKSVKSHEKINYFSNNILDFYEHELNFNVSYVIDSWEEDMDPKIFKFPDTVIGNKPELQDAKESKNLSMNHFKSMLDHPTRKCRHLVAVGGVYDCSSCKTCSKDGHKYICLDEDVRPCPTDCTVYSFGIGENQSFEEGMAIYNCTVFGFEVEANFTNRVPMENLHMLNLGLFDANVEAAFHMRDEARGEDGLLLASMRTLDTIMEILDHQRRKIDYLKMDIEFAEWRFFEYMFAQEESKNIFDQISQIAIELHLDDLKNKTTMQRITGAERYEKVLTNLLSAGYHLAITELNTFSQYFSDVLGTVIPVFRESLYVKTLTYEENRTNYLTQEKKRTNY